MVYVKSVQNIEISMSKTPKNSKDQHSDDTRTFREMERLEGGHLEKKAEEIQNKIK